MFSELPSRIGAAWCGLAHGSALWPIHGHYECRTCGRRYPAFEETPVGGGARKTASPHPPQLAARTSQTAAGLTRA